MTLKTDVVDIYNGSHNLPDDPPEKGEKTVVDVLEGIWDALILIAERVDALDHSDTSSSKNSPTSQE